jgi:Na+/proline symporter
MMPGWLLLLVALAYVGLLFTVAWLGERHPGLAQGPRLRPAVYALALAVYCSSWTFYGAVGTAARAGLGFLPIYLGPILLLLFGWRMLERLVLDPASTASCRSPTSCRRAMAARADWRPWSR